MGLFKSLGFGKKEGGSAEMKAEAPKSEQKETSMADTGRERINAMKEGASSLWKRFQGGAKSVGDSLAGKARDAYSMALGAKDRAIDGVKGAVTKGKEMAVEGAFAVVGGIEKGAKATVEAGKAVAEYTAESFQEGREIKDLAVDAAKDAATRTKDAVVEAGYTGAALAIMSGEKGVALANAMKARGIEVGSQAAKDLAEGASALAEFGIDALDAVRNYGAEKIDLAVKTANEAKAAGIDLKKRGGEFALDSLVAAVDAGISVAEAVSGAAGEVLDAGREIVGVAKERIDALRGKAREAKDGFFARMSAARDTFSSKLKKMVIESLRPEIDQLIQEKAQQLLADREALSTDDIAYEEEEAETSEGVA
ncbi:hypothetical protein HQ487_02720 [Candidatus Uhrbacteria bacterium]|nr:hypothetical protein [Candidatus Uhrbacteria bacterium]